EWSIGEASFETIISTIRNLLKKAKVVEFGSGPSSIRLAISLPDSHIISVESDRLFFNKTYALAEEFGVKNNLELRYSSLKFHKYGPGNILSYGKTSYFDGHNIDCVIIDGPPFYTLRGREACLYQIYPQLNIDGIVILDDYNREAE